MISAIALKIFMISAYISILSFITYVFVNAFRI